MPLLYVVLVAIVAASALATWVSCCLRIRRQRLSTILAQISTAERHLQCVPQSRAQAGLLKRMHEWSEASDARDALLLRVRNTPFPTIESPRPGEGLEDTSRRIAALLENPKLAVAVAGGEQVLQNLFEVVSPQAASHFAQAAATLATDDLVQAAMKAALDGAPQPLLEFGLRHIAQHGVSAAALTDLPGHVAQTLHTAGSHVMQGVGDISTQVHDVGQAMSDAAPGVGGHPGTVGAHFPWMTMLLSAFREFSLIVDEKTTVVRALTHVALDTAATGGGALAGFRAGAATGTFVAGPIGSAIGAGIGAIAGAIAGRYFAERAKRIRLESLWNAYNALAMQTQAALGASIQTFEQTIQHVSLDASAVYQTAVGKAPDFEISIQENRTQCDAALQLLEGVQREIDATSNEVDRELRAIRIPEVPVWQRVAGLNIAPAAIEHLRRADERRQSWAADLRSELPPKGGNSRETYSRLAHIPFPSSSDRHFLCAAEQAALFPDRFMQDVGTWLASATAAFQTGAVRLEQAAKDELARHQIEVTAWRSKLELVEQDIRRERSTLGLE